MAAEEKVKGKKGAQKDDKGSVSLEKQLLFTELEREISHSPHILFSRFERLNVQDMSELRRNLQKVSRRTVVAKHTLVKRILENIQAPEAIPFLEGSVLMTLAESEPQAVSKALVEFVKTHENVVLKGLISEGKIYGESFIKELAKLPPREELLTLVVTHLKLPIARLAMTLRGLLQSLVVVLNEVRKKKAETPAAG